MRDHKQFHRMVQRVTDVDRAKDAGRATQEDLKLQQRIINEYVKLVELDTGAHYAREAFGRL